MTAAPVPATVYRLDRAHAVRLFGLRMLVAAVLVVVAAVVLGIADGGVLRVVGVVLAVLAGVAVLAAVLVLVRPPVVVRLDAGGYRVRRVPDCGVQAAPWRGVADVTTGADDLGRTMEVRLTDGGRTVVPLVLVAHDARRLMLEVRERLDTAHGYRRLGAPGTPDSPTPGTT
ncbi:MAG: hypothetical protein Q7T56_13800 [Nocardioidaceae bacterium]|nr:hypothetical protein [Nocardioidaceae bacterium]